MPDRLRIFKSLDRSANAGKGLFHPGLEPDRFPGNLYIEKQVYMFLRNLPGREYIGLLPRDSRPWRKMRNQVENTPSGLEKGVDFFCPDKKILLKILL